MIPITLAKSESDVIYLAYITYNGLQKIIIFKIESRYLVFLQTIYCQTVLFNDKTVVEDTIRAEVTINKELFEGLFTPATCLFKLTSDEVDNFVVGMV